MLHLFNFMRHHESVRSWCEQANAAMHLEGSSLALQVEVKHQTMALLPKFMFKQPDGSLGYRYEISRGAKFCGWLPYQIRQWPAASDKLNFKRFCEAHGFLTPTAWHAGDPLSEIFIIKQRNGSWGKGILGPFTSKSFRNDPLALSEQQYFEGFIFGQPTKIWYWNARPVAIETVQTPYLTGDGQRSIEQILKSPRGSFDTAYDLPSNPEMLRCQGVDPSCIPDAGRRVLLDFLYASPYDVITTTTSQSIAAESPQRMTILNAIGKAMYREMSELHRDAIYTVDAVIDPDDELWLLEANCNPVIHPDTYGYMLSTLLLDRAV